MAEQAFPWRSLDENGNRAVDAMPQTPKIAAVSAPAAGFWKIALAVLVGNLMAALVIAFIYGLTRM